MNDWLNGFAYHVNLGASTFILAFLAMIFVATITVGFRTYRAAIRNPVEALREE